MFIVLKTIRQKCCHINRKRDYRYKKIERKRERERERERGRDRVWRERSKKYRENLIASI